jgi:hypothetical protein
MIFHLLSGFLLGFAAAVAVSRLYMRFNTEEKIRLGNCILLKDGSATLSAVINGRQRDIFYDNKRDGYYWLEDGTAVDKKLIGRLTDYVIAVQFNADIPGKSYEVIFSDSHSTHINPSIEPGKASSSKRLKSNSKG